MLEEMQGKSLMKKRHVYEWHKRFLWEGRQLPSAEGLTAEGTRTLTDILKDGF
jgi:hypothetical protein